MDWVQLVQGFSSFPSKFFAIFDDFSKLCSAFGCSIITTTNYQIWQKRNYEMKFMKKCILQSMLKYRSVEFQDPNFGYPTHHYTSLVSVCCFDLWISLTAGHTIIYPIHGWKKSFFLLIITLYIPHSSIWNTLYPTYMGWTIVLQRMNYRVNWTIVFLKMNYRVNYIYI